MKHFIFFLIGVLAASYIYFSWYTDMKTPVEKHEKVSQKTKTTTEQTQKIFPDHEEKVDDDTAQVNDTFIKQEEIHQPPQQRIEEKEDFEENVEESPLESIKAINAYKTTNIAALIANSTAVKLKIKAKEKDGIVKAKVFIAHDMLTPKQAETIGEKTNFITYIVGIVEKKVVFEVSTSQYLSKDPLFKFVFKGKRGNMLTIVYKQMDGTSFMASKKIK